MPWGRLDDDFYDNPKVTELLEEPEGWAALGFWTAMFSWAHRHTRRPGRTPGRLPRADVLRMDRANAARYAGLLVKVGLWDVPSGQDEMPSGQFWQIHDFEQYLPSARKMAAQKANASLGGKAKAARKLPTGQSLLPSGQRALPDGQPSIENLGQEDAAHALGRGKVVEEVQVVGTSVRGGAAKRGTRIPDDFKITEEMEAWGREHAPTVNGRRETEKFINYWRGKAGADALKVDWLATWKNWILRAAEQAPQLPAGPAVSVHDEHMMRR